MKKLNSILCKVNLYYDIYFFNRIIILQSKKKILLLLFLLHFLGICFSQQINPAINLDANSYSLKLPEGVVNFKVDTTKVLIKFRDNRSRGYLRTNENIFEFAGKKYDVTKTLNYYILHKKSSNENHLKWIEKLKKDSLIEYAAPVLKYQESMEQSIYDLFYIKIKKSSDTILIKQLANKLNFTIEKEYEKNIYFCRVTKVSAGNAFEIAKYIQGTNYFEFVEPDFIYTGNNATNDPNYNSQWALKNTGQNGGTVGADIDIENAWTISTGTSSIKVAILDCFGSLNQFTHPDISFYNTFDATNLGFSSSGFNHDAHGINCSGIIKATSNNSIGISGIAYNANIIAVKICRSTGGSSWTSPGTSIADGITWAYQNADVISNSNNFNSSSSLINNAISNSISFGRNGKGTPFLSSSGNNSSNSIGYPSTNTNTIAVGASDNKDARASFSDYGQGLDIVAPGVSIYSTDIVGGAGYSSGDYFLFNGTSAACPVAAGVMALILSVNPNLTYTEVRNILESTCDKVGSYTYNSNVNGQTNGTWSTFLGYGRINAYKATLAALATLNENCIFSNQNSPVPNIIDSDCNPFSCVSNGGILGYPIGPCPENSSFKFKVDNGEWVDTLPPYKQVGPPQIVRTRCVCNENPLIFTIENVITTNPDSCPVDCNCTFSNQNSPVPNIIDSECNPFSCITNGGILGYPIGPCPLNSTVKFKVDNGQWVDTLPQYNQTGPPQTVRTRCFCNENPLIYTIENVITTNPDSCPVDCNCNFSNQNSPVPNIIESNCNPYTCVSNEGLLGYPISECPQNSKMKFKVDNGQWVDTLPKYNQSGPPQTIRTSCFCNENSSIHTKESVVTTKPGICPAFCYCPKLNVIPNKVIIQNSSCSYPICQPNGGILIKPINNCPVGSTMEFSTNNGTSWSEILPIYFQSGSPQTIITRCNCNSDKSLSSQSSESVTTNPQKCPENCPCLSPSIQSKNITFTLSSTNQFTTNWVNGNGSRRVVKINTVNNFSPPSTGTDPIANSKYVGFGEQVVYNGPGNTVTITGLVPGTTYWIRIYEANCSGSNSVYNTSLGTNNPNSQRTRTVLPAVQSFSASNVVLNGNDIVDINPIYFTNQPYDVNTPIDIFLQGNNKTRFILNASSADGFSFQLVDQLTIVTDGSMAISPQIYGQLGPVISTSANTMYMDYTHPEFVNITPYLSLKIRLLFEGGLVGMSIPVHIHALQGALPVGLIDFQAQYNNHADINELSWITKSEANNDYFDIERSFESFSFENIGRVAGSGNSSTTIDYVFNDKNISQDGNYTYRLKQVDLNGRETFSKPASVKVLRSQSIKIGLFPNPASDLINCYVDAHEGAIVNIDIFNSLGRKVSLNVTPEIIGNMGLIRQIDSKDFGKGIFTVVFNIDGIRYNHKLIIIE